jgi:hypothetical protein
VLIVADDPVYEDVVARYAAILATGPLRRGPVTVLGTAAARLEIVRSGDAQEVLPGEPAPAPSRFAAMTVAVDDVAAARAIVEDGGTATRPAGDGFFVSARDAYGAGLFFTAR